MHIYGGSIRIHSDGAGKGSIFSFTMKMKRLQEQESPSIVESNENFENTPMSNDIFIQVPSGLSKNFLNANFDNDQDKGRSSLH